MASVTPPGREVLWKSEDSKGVLGLGKDVLDPLPNEPNRSLVGNQSDYSAVSAAI